MNGAAVAVIIVTGILMSMDETKILSIWSNMQTWTILLIIKIVGTLIMMALGFMQTTRALNKRYRINKSLFNYRSFYWYYFNTCWCYYESN